MKLGLINSAWLGSPVGTAEGIRLTKRIGFDTIDILADPMEIDIRERRLIGDDLQGSWTARDFGGLLRTGHRRFQRASAALPRRCALKRLSTLGYELGARNLLLVLGEYIWQQEVITPETQWNWAVEGTRELGDSRRQSRARNRHRTRAVPSFTGQRPAEDDSFR